jgi:hypothetical protein
VSANSYNNTGKVLTSTLTITGAGATATVTVTQSPVVFSLSAEGLHPIFRSTFLPRRQPLIRNPAKCGMSLAQNALFLQEKQALKI